MFFFIVCVAREKKMRVQSLTQLAIDTTIHSDPNRVFTDQQNIKGFEDLVRMGHVGGDSKASFIANFSKVIERNNKMLMSIFMAHPYFEQMSREELKEMFLMVCSSGQEHSIRAFIQNPRNFEAVKKSFAEAFERVAAMGVLTGVKELMAHSEFSKLSIEEFCWALNSACCFGKVNVVKELLAHTVCSEITHDRLSRAFTHAYEGGHLEVVEALINHPKFSEVRDSRLRRAVEFVEVCNNKELLVLLLSYPRFSSIYAMMKDDQSSEDEREKFAQMAIPIAEKKYIAMKRRIAEDEKRILMSFRVAMSLILTAMGYVFIAYLANQIQRKSPN